MNALEKFNKDFNEFVDITYNTYWDLPRVCREKYSGTIEKMVLDVLEDGDPLFNLSIEDLRQEISFFWLKHEKHYIKYRKSINATLRSYIIRRTIWDIRDWLRKHIHIIQIDFFPKEEKPSFGFKLNIEFLLKGTKNNLLNNLSPYERYIIFLVFKEEKSILEMSSILQKDRRIVKKHYDKILEKIKENNKNAFKKRNW